MQILMLYGGTGEEREVSVESATAVIGALAGTQHRVLALDYRGGKLSTALCEAMRQADAVFLALHGGEGEGGILQSRLEQAGIFHYTGAGPEAAALALDKGRAKAAVAAAGVPVAAGGVWLPQQAPPACPLPAILKPLCGGSSVGLSQVADAATLSALAPTAPMLLEEYLSGREYSVSVFCGRVLPIVEIRPQGGVYDYAHKYTPGATEELCPAPIDQDKTALLCRLATTAYHALGLRDAARIDFKEDAAGHPRFLEANTLPGLTSTSLLPLAAKTDGIPFPALCVAMAEAAAARRCVR